MFKWLGSVHIREVRGSNLVSEAGFPYRGILRFSAAIIDKLDRLCGQWSEYLATDPEIPGSIAGATRFSGK
jgi:hypothetical protein